LAPGKILKTGMGDGDPRILAVEASFEMLAQMTTTLTEFLIGPHQKNQHAVLNSETKQGGKVLECAMPLLYWLARRQENLRKGSSHGLSVQRKFVRKKRLEALMDAELAMLQLCDSILEGYEKDHFDGLILILMRESEDSFLTDGMEVLVENLSIHDHTARLGSMARPATAGSRQQVQNSPKAAFQELEHLNLLISRLYYVILAKLQSHDPSVRTAVDAYMSNDKREVYTPRSRVSSANGAARNRKNAVKKIEKSIRQVQIKVTGQEGKQKYQMLYFNVPDSCITQQNSQLVTLFCRAMYDPDEYLESPWRQRHICILRGMLNYIDVHDHQKVFDDVFVLRLFQFVGGLSDLVIVHSCYVCYLLTTTTNSATTEYEPDTLMVFNAHVHVVLSMIKFMFYFSQMPLVLAKRAYRDHDGAYIWIRCFHAVVATFSVDGVESIFMLLYLGASWAGLLVDVYFFAFHLLGFFFLTEIAKLLLAVVIGRLSQLIQTVFLGFVLTYIFAAVGWRLVS
jgi:hypothetical protein